MQTRSFIGMDVHKETISMSIAEDGREGPVRFLGVISNTPDDVSKTAKRLSSHGELDFCYEAGCCGYGIYRQLTDLGHRCMVVAPSLIPRKPGERIKTDRRDSQKLAILQVLVQTAGSWEDQQMARLVPVEELFKGRHFDREIVVLCVRWYLSFKLSYRDLVAMMTERGITLAHTTILRWVQTYTPEFQKRWNRFARTVGGSCDVTRRRSREGLWVYLYRAVDKAGKTVEFYLSRNRDVNAGKAFLRKAIKNQRMPTKITLDAYAASHRAVADLKASGELSKRVRVRSNKYINNLIEQDHRRVKQRLRPMLGLKSFRTAAIVISGIELAEKIKKGQYKFGKLGGRTARCRYFGERHWLLNRSNNQSSGKSSEIGTSV